MANRQIYQLTAAGSPLGTWVLAIQAPTGATEANNITPSILKTLMSLVKGDVGLGNVDNTSDINKPVSTAQAAAITAATIGLLDDRGNYNASSNLFPATGGSGSAGAILKGDLWTVSVGGTLGGIAVTIGDIVRALVDTPAQTVGNWAITENNIGYIPENSANKSNDTTLASDSTTQYPTVHAVKVFAESLGGGTPGEFIANSAVKIGTKFTYNWNANPLNLSIWTDQTSDFNPTTDGIKTTFAGGGLNLNNTIFTTNVNFGAQNYTIYQKVKCKVKDANSHGIGFWIKANRPLAPQNFAYFMLANTEGHVAYGVTEAAPPAGFIADNIGKSNFIWSVDDELGLYLIRRDKRVFVRMVNLGPSAGKGCTSELEVFGTAGIAGGVGKFYLAFFGGTWELQEPLTITYDDIKESAFVLLTDSVGDGAGAANYADSWFYRLNTSIKGGIVRMGCGFEKLEDGLSRVPDALLADPYGGYAIELGINNFNAGDSPSTLVTKLEALIDALQVGDPGKAILVSSISPQGSDATAANTAMKIAALAKGCIWVDSFTILKNPSGTGLDTKYIDNGDTIHPGTLAQPILAGLYREAMRPYVQFNLPIDISALPYSDKALFVVGRDWEGKQVIMDFRNFTNYIWNIGPYTGGVTKLQPNTHAGFDGDLRVGGELKVYLTSAGGSESNPNFHVNKITGFTQFTGFQLGNTGSPPIKSDVNGLSFDATQAAGKLFFSGGSTQTNIWAYNRKFKIERTQGEGGVNPVGLQIVNSASTVPSSDYRGIQVSRHNGTIEEEVFAIGRDGQILIDKTITTTGTTGDQTINKPLGSVNIAAAGTAVTVTNNLVTTTSLIKAWLCTNDATAKTAVAVAGSGSFVITLNAAATGEVRVAFEIL